MEQKKFKLNRKVWAIVFSTLVLLTIASYFENGKNLSVVYLECVNDFPCLNPYYNTTSEYCEIDVSVCATEFISPGEYLGRKPGFILRNYNLIFFIILSLGAICDFVLRRVKNENRNKK